MIDTHTHLYLPEFEDDNDGEATVNRALEAGIDKLIFPNVDIGTIGPMRRLAAKFPGHAYMAMGLHPTEINDDWKEALAAVMQEFDVNRNDYVAIGEIGIDLYWDATYCQQQMMALEQQATIATDHGLPIIIHCREGLPQTLEVLQGVKGAKGVFHSFGGTIDDVRSIRNVGDFYFGINGVATFKNCKVKDTFHEIGIDRILLETDAPYLAPVPYRGKRNESAYMVHTARFIADHLGIPLDDLDQATTQNAERLFKI